MKTISFLCMPHAPEFLTDIIENLKQDYNVITAFSNEVEDQKKAIDQSDIVWIEWLDRMAIDLSNSDLLKGKKTIIRLHGYEAFRKAPLAIKWENIDRLVLVSNYMKEIIGSYLPKLEEKVQIEIINNGVDLAKFRYKKRKRGYNLAIVGSIDSMKVGIHSLHFLLKLCKIDPNYKLHIVGNIMDMKYGIAFNVQKHKLGLEDNVVLHGYLNDVPTFLDSMNYLVSFSLFESFGISIIEGAAMGLKPVLSYWYDARQLYPDDWIFYESNLFLSRIFEEKYESEKYRDFVEKNYSLEIQMNKTRKMIEGL